MSRKKTPYKFMKHARAYMNTTTGTYIYPHMPEYSKVIDFINVRHEKLMKKINKRNLL